MVPIIGTVLNTLVAISRWFFFPPAKGGATACDNFDVRWGGHFGKPVAEWLKEDYWVLEEPPIEATQCAGDVVYVPFGWGHAVCNLTECVGVAKEVGYPQELARLLPGRW